MLQTQMEQVLHQIGEVNRKLDNLSNTFVSKVEFETYKALQAPAQKFWDKVRDKATDAMVWGMIIGFCLVFATYISSILKINR